MTHQKYKERLPVIPEQNKALIAGICLCQMTVVLSLVAFIYLSVAIYMPSHKAFNSGIHATPVTCQTIETVMINNCSWASCGEWCLTKTTGFCPQIHVTVRNNGTDILMENCTRISHYACPQAEPEALIRYNCNNGTQCSTLTGLFNCSLGHCSNMSELFQCYYKADGITVDSEKDNMKLNGFFACNHSVCTKIKKSFSCDRYCPKITSIAVNSYLMFDDYLYTGECQKATAIWPDRKEIWPPERSKREYMFASCMKVERIDNTTLKGVDCINGTSIPNTTFNETFINFTTLWSIVEKSDKLIDSTEKYMPWQKTLTIYNQSRLYINLDGCVNTLKGECKEFHLTHGRDGRNKTAQSRFPCFYNPTNSFMAVARFDLNKTWKEFIVALVVPTVLFFVSFTTLMVITRSVKVGDDSILRCQLCSPRRESTEKLKEREDLTKAEQNDISNFADNNGGAMVL